MRRFRRLQLATAAALAACSSGPSGDVRWLTLPTAAQHSALYFSIASGPHAVDCDSCHGGTPTFVDFDCLSCHPQAPTTASHAAIGGFTYDSPSCYGCHPDGTKSGAIDHTRKFPIAPGQVHAIGSPSVHLQGTIQCASCHTKAAAWASVDCTVCHTSTAMQPLHAAVGDLPASYASPDTATSATTALCLKCHADSTVPASIASAHTPPAPAHTPFLVASGTAHFRQDCLGCHVASRTDKPWAADFAQAQHCTGCHVEPATSANHLSTSWPGYPGTYGYTDAACLGCHADGSIGPFEHSASFPTAPGNVHSSGVAPCLSCHTSSTAPDDITTISCVGCHDNSASSVDPGGVNAKHTTPAAGANMVGFGYTFDTSTPSAAIATNGLCLKCHAGTIATKSWKNTLVLPLTQHSSLCFGVSSGDHRVNQSRNGTPACFVCHSAMNTGSKPWGVDWAQAACTPCHTNRTPTTCR